MSGPTGTTEKPTIENFGIAPGPLDAYRGTGRVARALGLLPKPSEPLTRQVGRTSEPDPAVATIKKSVKISPCPCGDPKCNALIATTE